MASYRIWSRTQALDNGHYLCTVIAVPIETNLGLRSESEARAFASYSVAEQARADMICALRDRLEKRGDQVAAVESV